MANTQIVTQIEKLLVEYVSQKTIDGELINPRLVYTGPPVDILRQLFLRMSNNNGSSWNVNGNISIPVFLVTTKPCMAQNGGPSKECNWDYALAARNSYSCFIVLVDPDTWDERTYSMINATDIVGYPLPPIRRKLSGLNKWNLSYSDLVNQIADEIGILRATVEKVIVEALQELPALPPSVQRVYPWELLGRILDLQSSNGICDNDLFGVCGLLNIGNTQKEPMESWKTLKKLSDYLASNGFNNGSVELVITPRGEQYCTEIGDMIEHLRSGAGSASLLANAPAYYAYSGWPLSNWWQTLTIDVISDILNSLGQASTQDKIILRCENHLNHNPSNNEPCIVASSVELVASANNLSTIESPRLIRQLGRKKETLEDHQHQTVQCPWILNDDQVIPHQTPIKYLVQGDDVTECSIQVISLYSWVPGGFVRSGSAAKVGKVTWDKQRKVWSQQLDIRKSGSIRLEVYTNPIVENVIPQSMEENGQFYPPGDENTKYYQIESCDNCFVINVDDDQEKIGIILLGSSGEEVSRLVIELVVFEEDTDTFRSRLYALVSAHQTGSKLGDVRSVDCWLRHAEQNLLSLEHGYPVVATHGWSNWMASTNRERSDIIFGTRTLTADPRPVFGPDNFPLDFLTARRKVSNWILNREQSIPELDLSGPEARDLATEYIEAYNRWLESEPSIACWIDTIIILEDEIVQAGIAPCAAHEPIALLVSPLHPVRLAWQVSAQILLEESLEQRCPLAGMLNPHRSPDIFPLPLQSGGQERWTAFVSIPCEEEGWALYWNIDKLNKMINSNVVLELQRAGLAPKGFQAGFTRSQAIRTLDETRKVMPTRASFRIGIVSSGEGESTCADGLLDWCKGLYNDDKSSLYRPSSVEIFDSRLEMERLLPAEMSYWADETGYRVKWFSRDNNIEKDLLIIDHLGMASPTAVDEPWISVTSRGALAKSRIRADFDEAQFVTESRIGKYVECDDQLLNQLGKVVAKLEQLAHDKASKSHVRFCPNRNVMIQELSNTRFLAVSSTEVDLACFSRGAPAGGGYLWDYELPSGIGPGEQGSGFYLVAKPSMVMKKALQNAIGLVSHETMDVDSLLFETSRRGIPILKRLSAGGSLARGELGMLMAVRLLQDAFRVGGIPRLPVLDDNSINLIIPIDPYVDPLSKISKSILGKSSLIRPDLLAVNIKYGNSSRIEFCFTPIEIKFREGIMGINEMKEALKQASYLGEILESLLINIPRSELWDICTRAFLVELLDQSFRVYGDQQVLGIDPNQWALKQQQILQSLMEDSAIIRVIKEGRLIVFDSSYPTRYECLVNNDLPDTLIVSRDDAEKLLGSNNSFSSELEQIDVFLGFNSSNAVPFNQEDIVPIVLRTGGLSSHAEFQVQEEDLIPESGSTTETSSDDVVVPEGNEDSVGNTSTGGVPCTLPREETRHDHNNVITTQIRDTVNMVFDGFIGNNEAVEMLKRSILKAHLSNPPELPYNFILTGNPSTGKTELARRVSKGLKMPFVQLDGRAINKPDKIFEFMDNVMLDNHMEHRKVGIQYQRDVFEYPPLVVFIDEVHLMSRATQEGLLTVLEPNDRRIVLESKVALVSKTTFIFATTRLSEIDSAFKSRCVEISLRDYGQDEVAQIIKAKYPRWDESVIMLIAKLGRMVPRIALKLAQDLEDEIQVSSHPGRNVMEHLDAVRKTHRIDPNGLRPYDIEYLNLLNHQDKPIGEKHIINMMTNVDKDRILEEVEPLLIGRLHLVKKTERGRVITPEGRRYLSELRRHGNGL